MTTQIPISSLHCCAENWWRLVDLLCQAYHTDILLMFASPFLAPKDESPEIYLGIEGFLSFAMILTDLEKKVESMGGTTTTTATLELKKRGTLRFQWVRDPFNDTGATFEMYWYYTKILAARKTAGGWSVRWTPNGECEEGGLLYNAKIATIERRLGSVE